MPSSDTTTSDRRHVRTLDGTGASAGEVGGKAASLDRLVEAGFPVPAAVAVTAAAYRAFVEDAGLSFLLEDLGAADLPPPDAIEEETRRVDRAFLEPALPEALREEIGAVARDLLLRGPVAVRSSATAEDLATASFAGQYRTFLDVGTEDGVQEAIRRCWASLWAPSVRAYRRREKVGEKDLAMGVILQSMVPAEWAGVLFTRDPQGEHDTARVEAVRGLGEALVSGRVTPEDYRVGRAGLEARGAQNGQGFPLLEDLVRLGLRIERRLGGPQDVEWAYAGGDLLVLQSRPITISGRRQAEDDGFDTDPEPGATYTPAGVQEMLPGVLPPLLWTINAPMLDDAFRRLFAELGIPVPETSGPFLVLGRFRGRAALNLSVLRESAATMPGGSAAEVERQYLGRALSAEGKAAPRRGWLKRAVAGLKALRVRRRVEDEIALFSEAVSLLPALGIDLRALPVRRLLAYRARVRDLAWRGYAAEVTASAGAAAAYRALETVLERWVGEDAAQWAQRITSPPPPAQQAGCNCAVELWDAYATHARSEPACECLLGGSPETTEERLRALGDEGRRFVELVRSTGRYHGSKAMYGGSTWGEDPGLLWDCVGSLARCDVAGETDPVTRMAEAQQHTEGAVRDLQEKLRRSWKWRLTRIITGQVVDTRSRLLRRLAADASRFLALREQAKAALLVLGGEERRLIREAAGRLTVSGLLGDPEEALFLEDQELEEMLLGGEPVSAEELAQRRNAQERAGRADPLPEIFEGHPSVEEIPVVAGAVVEGWAASPGRVRGRARVLRSLEEGSALVPGDIIVARSTDPSWTPLFLVAGGIVLEEGGPLSHAAIVAREFGLPAVLNVKGATRLIESGEEVEVDGTVGAVTRIPSEVVVA